MGWFGELAFNVLYAGAILVAAFWLSGWVRGQVERIGRRYEEVDETLFSFLGSVARYAVLAVAVIFVLGRFGIQTTSLVALIGAAGLAIGLALQGTLSNLAAGVMLVAFRPFKNGDYIGAAGQSGTVRAITLFTTELVTPDNVLIIVPNGDIWASAITNFSAFDSRRCDLVFGVAYGADLKTA
jgi:small conductance mechanosensitive channel